MLGRHLLGYLPVNLAQVIVGFGGVWALTRLLETGEYGQYAVIMAAMSFLHVPLFTWIEAGAARFYARAAARGETRSHFATLLAIYAAVALPASLILALITVFAPMPETMRMAFAFMAASILFRSLVKLVLESYRAEHRVRRYGLTETLNLLGGFGLGLAFIMFTPLRAAGPFAGLLCAAVVVLAFEAPKLIRRSDAAPDWKRAKTYALYGLPISLSLILSHAVATSDRFLIAWILGDASVGVYSAGYALADRTIDVLFIWIGLAAAPLAITALEQGGRVKAREAARRNAMMMALVGAPAAIGLGLVADPLAAVMTGEAFRDQASRIIPWIAISGFLNGFMVYYLHEAFILAKRTRIIPLVMIAPAVLNVALNLILLPRMGVMGAVVATVAAYGLGAVLSGVMGRRYFPLPLPWGEFAKVGAACGVMALGVWLVPAFGAAFVTLLAKAVVGAVIYAAAIWAIDAGEIRVLASEIMPGRFGVKEAAA